VPLRLWRKLWPIDPSDTRFRDTAKAAVMTDLSARVDELTEAHAGARAPWWPSEVYPVARTPEADQERALLRERARGIPEGVKIALALNLITEEGLPHYHHAISTSFGDDGPWHRWAHLWTAEEDRHGCVIRDYCRDAALLRLEAVERLQFEFLRGGFTIHGTSRDPYEVLAYVALQERATQVAHGNTGVEAARYEPTLAQILTRVAFDEARHYGFYRQIFAEVLARDPCSALQAAAVVIGSLEMPAARIPRFREYAEVVRRSGIYGPRQFLEIVEEQIAFWKIGGFSGLTDAGREAQDRIMATPDRLRRIVEAVEDRARGPRTFTFELLGDRPFIVE
jgi:acyl-[acyl-carrier-protein] desaturase